MCDVAVSIDDDLLGDIDSAAMEQGVSRSAYLSQVIAREIRGARKRRPEDSRVRQALRELDELFAGLAPDEDATAAIREERDAR